MTFSGTRPRLTGPTPAAGPVDPYVVDLVADPSTPARLRLFNQAGVLAPADVHTAIRLARMGGEQDDRILLAIALAVRGPRVGHVSVDLAEVRSSVVVGEEDVDLEALPWPEPEAWLASVSASPLVSSPGSPDSTGVRPLRLSGTALYLDRYWRDEEALGDDLLVRAAWDGGADVPDAGITGAIGAAFRSPVEPPEGGVVGDPEESPSPELLERLFPGTGSADQRAAAAAAATRRLCVIAGGPGTGKTTTVARLLALLGEQAWSQGTRPPLVALAAPTGKAAARMEEAVREEADRLDTPEPVKAGLRTVAGTTIHRLLGTRPDRPGKFRHHRGHRLPHDVVVIDEASMVSLSLMARLVEAVRPDARLVLVGDPEQLVSVEAGAVLADIVSPATEVRADGIGAPGPPPGGSGGPGGPGGRRGPVGPGGSGGAPGSPMQGAVRRLRTNHRFDGSLARLAEAIRSGQSDDVMAILRDGATGDDGGSGGGEPPGGGVEWLGVDPADVSAAPPLGPSRAGSDAVRHRILTWARAVQEAAGQGDVDGALAWLRSHRVLCAHREGPSGVMVWNRLVESWLAESLAGVVGRPGSSLVGTTGAAAVRHPVGADGGERAGSVAPWSVWYPGRPVLVTANDYGLRLYNGDTGIAVAGVGADGPAGSPSLRVVFDAGPGHLGRIFSPSRLASVETVFAMTVHKSQGSEFDAVTLLLPAESSRLLTRELLYTAVTRARRRIVIVGTEEAIRQAVGHRMARASGLGRRLWGPSA